MTNYREVRTQDPTGYIHIEDVRFPLAVGGIRLISGVTSDEIKLLSKAMSLKLHTFGFPISGAKGGVNSDDINDFYNFIAKPQVKSLLTGDNQFGIQFITGPDIGTSEDEYYKALELTGLDHLIRRGLLANKSSNYGLPLDNIITAYGLIVAMETLLGKSNEKDPLKDKKICLEGFGKVGTGIAIQLKDRCKIVGVSTRYGSIRNDSGFDVDELLKLQNEYGDNCIFHMKTEVMGCDDLFSIPTDILIPGARTEVITKDIAERILSQSTKFIVPVSNFPYTVEGRELLEKSGVVCFPDFIASAGAVIAAMIEFANKGGEDEAFKLVKAAISTETKILMGQTLSTVGAFLYEIACTNALDRKKQLLKNYTNDDISLVSLANQVISNYLY